ncbi:MAG: bifunctional adenosylcobinamide kinase/adenosylcobinamide-phosphate guanylyltransferase [Bacillota bacterium]|nr:bifunctional adenosylcobinamide kinase/adenosylcobinamide-phosphate guanylyltransferase [Bacillota bacterium]
MIVFVTGGSGCGKSKMAEDITTSLGGDLVYIATMPIKGPEEEKKVDRHHKLRAGKGFETIERQNKLDEIPLNSTVLLECISNYVANRMYSGDVSDNWVDSLFDEIKCLADANQNLVIVSVESGSDGITYDDFTEEYKKVLFGLNNKLVEFSDVAIESVYGIPNILKGEMPC